MWPSLLLLRINRVWLPLPIILLWPLLGLVVLFAASLGRVSAGEKSRFVCQLICQLGALRGLQVDIEDKQQRIVCKVI